MDSSCITLFSRAVWGVKHSAHPVPKGNPVNIPEPEEWAECGPLVF